jgi:hypothetical protein
MLSDDEKTPSLIAVDSDLLRSTAATPGSRKAKPAGRPPGAFSMSELVEKITEDVRRGTADELDRKQRELRAELGAEIRSAATLGIAALVMNAVAILAVLGFAHALPGRGVGAALVGLTIVFVAAVTVGSRHSGTIAK